MMSALGWKVVLHISIALSQPHDVEMTPEITVEVEEVRPENYLHEDFRVFNNSKAHLCDQYQNCHWHVDDSGMRREK